MNPMQFQGQGDEQVLQLLLSLLGGQGMQNQEEDDFLGDDQGFEDLVAQLSGNPGNQLGQQPGMDNIAQILQLFGGR